jgi:hypothetical protein
MHVQNAVVGEAETYSAHPVIHNLRLTNQPEPNVTQKTQFLHEGQTIHR